MDTKEINKTVLNKYKDSEKVSEVLQLLDVLNDTDYSLVEKIYPQEKFTEYINFFEKNKILFLKITKLLKKIKILKIEKFWI